MKFFYIILLLSSVLCAETKPEDLIQKTYRYDKIMVYNHTYIVISEEILGAQNQVLHDPDCRCRRFTEEQIAKVVQEVIRLKDNQKPP